MMITGRSQIKGVSRKLGIGRWLSCITLSIQVAAYIVFALVTPRLVHAAVFNCSSVSCLTNKISTANSNGQDNTINLAAGTYTLTAVDNNTDGANGLPSIKGTITIKGSGADTTIIERDASAPRFRIFHVAATGALTLDGVTIRVGVASFDSSGIGGGIFNNGGTLNIADSTITDNVADSQGGGIWNQFGTVNVIKSTISDNGAIDGGGIFDFRGTITITNSTLSGNFVLEGSGGGIFNRSGTVNVTHSIISGNSAEDVGGGGILNSGTMTFTNSTISDNFGFFDGGAVLNVGTMTITNSTIANNTATELGGGIFNRSGTVKLQNTILALNTAPDGTGADCFGPVTSLGNNIIGDATGCDPTNGPNDLSGDPGLDAFTDNGTPGNGHFPLLSDSRAIDAGNNNMCLHDPVLATDQIGQPRIGVCDIGAIEFQRLICSKAKPSISKLWPPNHNFVSINILDVTDPNGDPVSITINSTRQDEPVKEPGTGNTCPDANGVGTNTAHVRAERAESGDGRVYHIRFMANNGKGETCTGAVAVCVPHDQGKGKTCVDGGSLFDSTVCH